MNGQHFRILLSIVMFVLIIGCLNVDSPEELNKKGLLLNSQGDALYNLSKYDEAISSYNQALELFGREFELRNALLKRHDEVGRVGSNLSELNFLRENIGISLTYMGTTWFDKGLALINLEKYEESITALNEALKRYEEAVRVDSNLSNSETLWNFKEITWKWKGAVLYRLGNYGEAIDAFNQAIKLDPNYASAWSWKGLALYGLGMYNQAIDAFNQAIKLDPNDALVWADKGSALGKLGKYDESAQAYDQATKINSGCANIKDRERAMKLNKIAIMVNAYVGAPEKYEKSISAYEQSLKIYSQCTEG